MGSILKKLKLSHKSLACPRCKRQLRVPLKPGKILRITCPSCSSKFDISFKNPILDMFNWDNSKDFPSNIKLVFKNFNTLPTRAKLTIALFIGAILYIGVSFYQGSQTKEFSTPNAPQLEQSLF
ncbi:hypothetical protein DID80_01890 [Candidatus Marinamargulisbacteria bacterium SCGC AAA071-K20]|nr:hypothetical protein DID80_01890 [Candidatus Marinamargulisbacteria bacterium SCGC AAA071-K20]